MWQVRREKCWQECGEGAGESPPTLQPAAHPCRSNESLCAFHLPMRTKKGGSGAAAFHVLLSAFLTLCLFLFHLFSLFFQKRKSSSSVQLMVSVLRLPKCQYCWASPQVPASPVFGSYFGVGKKGQRGWREHPQSRITHKPH